MVPVLKVALCPSVRLPALADFHSPAADAVSFGAKLLRVFVLLLPSLSHLQLSGATLVVIVQPRPSNSVCQYNAVALSPSFLSCVRARRKPRMKKRNEVHTTTLLTLAHKERKEKKNATYSEASPSHSS